MIITELASLSPKETVSLFKIIFPINLSCKLFYYLHSWPGFSVTSPLLAANILPGKEAVWATESLREQILVKLPLDWQERTRSQFKEGLGNAS